MNQIKHILSSKYDSWTDIFRNTSYLTLPNCRKCRRKSLVHFYFLFFSFFKYFKFSAVLYNVKAPAIYVFLYQRLSRAFTIVFNSAKSIRRTMTYRKDRCTHTMIFQVLPAAHLNIFFIVMKSLFLSFALFSCFSYCLSFSLDTLPYGISFYFVKIVHDGFLQLPIVC